MFAEKTFDTGPVAINYAEGPVNGPPLLLLHGLGTRWQSFLAIMPALAERWHVYAWDARGHGKSGRVAGAYTAHDYVTDLQQFITGLFDEPVIVFGSSKGGAVALALAAQQPDLFRALVVGDTPLGIVDRIPTAGPSPFYQERRALAGKPLADVTAALRANDHPPHLLETESQMLANLDPDVLAYAAEGRLAEYFAGYERPDYARITCPVLLVQGNAEMGAALSDADIAQVRAAMPHAQVAYLAESGHGLGLFTGAVAPLLAALDEFLSLFAKDK